MLLLFACSRRIVRSALSELTRRSFFTLVEISMYLITCISGHIVILLVRYAAAEADCNQALSLDASYTKAFLRRGAARFQLGRVQEAEVDYRAALKLEPNNKQAQEELRNITKVNPSRFDLSINQSIFIQTHACVICRESILRNTDS